MMAANIAIPNAIASRNCSLGSNCSPSADNSAELSPKTGKDESDATEETSGVSALDEWFAKNDGKKEQILPPTTPQQRAIKSAIRISRKNTWLIFKAARSPVASPQTTIADV